MSDLTSVTLLDRIKDPMDSGSWREFSDLYHRVVLRWLQSQGLALQDAEDITQEIMCVVCREIGRFDHNGRTGAFRSWLRRVTANRLREFWRDRRRKAGAGPNLQVLAESLVDDGAAISKTFDREHDRYIIEQMLQSLQDRFHEKSVRAFREITLEQRPVGEVAAKLNMSEGAVRVAQCRVLQRLRAIDAGTFCNESKIGNASV